MHFGILLYLFGLLLFLLLNYQFAPHYMRILFQNHLKNLSYCFEEEGYVGLNSTSSSFLATIFISSLFLLSNFNGLLISRGYLANVILLCSFY